MKEIYIVLMLLLSVVQYSVGQDSLTTKKDSTLPLDIVAFIEKEIATEGLQMTCQELRKQQGEPQKIVVLDTRDKSSYRKNHIKGARRVGVQGKDFTLKNVWYLNRNKIIIVYCNNGVEGKKVAAKLREMGFSKTYNLLGGIEAWNKRLLPTQGTKKRK